MRKISLAPLAPLFRLKRRGLMGLIVVSLVLVGFTGGVLAQGVELPDPGLPAEGLPKAGLAPDSPFYFLEMISEGIGTFFTFGDVAKAERYAKLAAERVAEAKAVVDKGKPEVAEKALVRYQDQLEKALARAEKAQAKGKSVSEVTEIVSQATAKHLTVLEEVLERVPEQAKTAILQAREVSKTGQVRALEGLAKEKPERAANLNIQAIQNRLEKVKNEAREGDEQGAERTLSDFAVFKTSLEKMGKENKMVLASLVSENMTGQIEVLDEVEDEAENISPQMAEKVKAIKASAINGQVDVLRSLAEVNPEEAAEIFSIAAEKRLNKAKQDAEDRDTKEAEEAVEEFEKYAAFGQEISGIAQGIGKDTTTVEQLVARATTHHLEVLNDVLGKVPVQAQEAVKKAMTASETGRQQAVEALKEKGALENIPETVPVPWEVKEKVLEERKIPKPETPKLDVTSCVDLCGDGVCQEVVCMAIGCPCAESPKTCPQDCSKELEIEKPEAKTPETPEISP